MSVERIEGVSALSKTVDKVSALVLQVAAGSQVNKGPVVQQSTLTVVVAGASVINLEEV